jgi:4-hydroxyphenylpyruvate dioxygenase
MKIMNTNPRHKIHSFESVELYVGNAYQAAHYFQTSFGFRPRQTSGLETGRTDAISTLLTQGEVELIVTSPLTTGPIADHIHRHGDAVADVALLVRDVEALFARALQNGARAIMEPRDVHCGDRIMKKATIGTPGDLCHSLVERPTADRTLLPHARHVSTPAGRRAAKSAGLQTIDHIALAVNPGDLDTWIDFYQAVFGFDITHRETTSTELTAMRSIVVENIAGTVKIQIVEPAGGSKSSQVSEFLRFNGGPGVQHIALLCPDISFTLQTLKSRGVEFLCVPDAYYDALPERLGELDGQVQELREIRALADRDEWGHLIQTFSKPVTGRPTLFLELVQRNGARGFGRGNLRALLEAVEREQAMRAGW